MDYLERMGKLRIEMNKSKTKPFKMKEISDENVILLSASHASRHVREGEVKSEKGETVTAIVVEDIQTLINEHYKEKKIGIIYKTGNEYDDPNYSKESKYRKEVLRIIEENKNIELVIDFHNMHLRREYDVDIGVNGYLNVKGNQELIKNLKSYFTEQELLTFVDKNFKADGENNLSKVVAEKNNNVKTIQLEANYKIVINKKDYVSFVYSMVNFLVEYIEKKKK